MNRDVRRLSKAACALDGIYWYIAKASGVKENLLWLLYALDDEEVHTQKQICEEWLFPKTTINTLIKECQGAGYIDLRPIPGRGRELAICLTDAGRAYTRKALGMMYDIEDAALAEALRDCSPSFIGDFERFVAALHTAAGERLKGESG